MDAPPPDAFDVFLSYSRTDGGAFTHELARALERRGLRAWHDEAQLGPGQSVSATIAAGLARARSAVVVLSPTYLHKVWTTHELQGLWQRDRAGETRMIPVLHGISHAEVRRHDATLADKCALDAAIGADLVADAVVRVLRGDAPAPGTTDTPPPVPTLGGFRALPAEEQRAVARAWVDRARAQFGDPRNTLGAGICLLALGRYAEARKQLAAALGVDPTLGAAHLHDGLCLLAGRRPRLASRAEIGAVVTRLHAARDAFPDDGIPDLAAALVKHDYFAFHCVRCPPPSVEAHLAEAAALPVDPAERDALIALLGIPGDALPELVHPPHIMNGRP